MRDYLDKNDVTREYKYSGFESVFDNFQSYEVKDFLEKKGYDVDHSGRMEFREERSYTCVPKLTYSDMTYYFNSDGVEIASHFSDRLFIQETPREWCSEFKDNLVII